MIKLFFVVEALKNCFNIFNYKLTVFGYQYR